MDITDEQIAEINRWLKRVIDQGEVVPPQGDHFLDGFDHDWMLYGTGTAQLQYLAVLDAVSEVLLHKSVSVYKRGIEYRRQQISGRKEVLPNVSNYYIQFNMETVTIVGTGDPNRPVRLAGGDFPTRESLDFFESFDESPFSLSGISLQKISQGMQKHNQRALRLVDLGRGVYQPLAQKMIRHFAVRRACKFLLYEAIGRGLTIRYVLDDLSLLMAAERARKDERVPVCTSELREVFRCWDYFRTRVTLLSRICEGLPTMGVTSRRCKHRKSMGSLCR